ncbi:hypothetical protein CVIRNUC_001722 [Coccomyxa viridis]|uniref:Ubiquinone biosynthesis protein n=1 Tax=Coccomyxa viridis TaxID=1274662 RepID=A0AAV1HVN2_9CHLO|nr:hypothetical protein CVIRNUC_001722 [Coccomyxa viridis]
MPEGMEDAGDEEQQESQVEMEMRLRLLESALKHVAKLGWSGAALQAGANDLGLSRAAAGVVPNGAAGLVEYFVNNCNQRLVDHLEDRADELGSMRTPQRVRLALQARLEMLIPVMDTWPQALAIQASPAHMGTMLKQRAQLVDDIWHACGDTATDYNWYTKRGLLAAVYAATELFMITDYSPGYADTWQSLDRRLADVKRFGSAATEVRKYSDGLLKSVGSMAVWAQEALVNAQKQRQQSHPS